MIETEVHFEGHKNIIENELNKAKSSVQIAVAWINFKSYFQIFYQLIERGIVLHIICSDNHQNRSHLKEIQNLRDKRANIRLLKMPNSRNHMHHKFVIIDDNVIINGSFNWSPNAEKSIENLMVIRNAFNAVKEFKSEFLRLSSIEGATIKGLQKVYGCAVKNCIGQLFNILVFSEKSTRYYETYGDVICVCNECLDNRVVKSCISNNQIELLLSELFKASDDLEYQLIEDSIEMELLSYQNDSEIIHAIGRVKSYMDFNDDEWVKTLIIWKNKFVNEELQDEFDNEHFYVVYDN